jgi:hypothetical protein
VCVCVGGDINISLLNQLSMEYIMILIIWYVYIKKKIYFIYRLCCHQNIQLNHYLSHKANWFSFHGQPVQVKNTKIFHIGLILIGDLPRFWIFFSYFFIFLNKNRNKMTYNKILKNPKLGYYNWFSLNSYI